MGMIQVQSRKLIPIPYAWPADEFAVLLGDWYNKGHKTLKKTLDSGHTIGLPDGIQINGKSGKVGDNAAEPLATMEPGKTYRFSKKQLTSVAIIRYADGKGPASPELPPPPPQNVAGIAWSVNQFRSFRWNLTSNAARPNPQGSYHYGKINITRTIRLANFRGTHDGKLRFGINGVSHQNPATPLKIAEYFGKPDLAFINYDLLKDEPPKEISTSVVTGSVVVNATFRNFVEIIFENQENTIQTWHLDGHSFFAVAIEHGKWSPEKRKNYNLLDAVSRNTIQVYPNSWAAVLTTLDNAGMWNLRSEMAERAYLGQQFYFSVLSPGRSTRDEYNIPPNHQLCGRLLDIPKSELPQSPPYA
ncbi:UNVERIFIED_CONTAM: L-ascorbate oxidase [Sesamum radiatum]|uniref:L-ascorbate oxidase n=1 Tax=Sesamum radiatum TaxID=300843 RepID=A0AAW2W2P0_SESRA